VSITSKVQRTPSICTISTNGPKPARQTHTLYLYDKHKQSEAPPDRRFRLNCLAMRRTVLRGAQVAMTTVTTIFAMKDNSSACCGDCIASFNTDELDKIHDQRALKSSTTTSAFVTPSRPSESASGRASELTIQEMEVELSKRRTSR